MKEGWEYKKLGEIATYINGFPFKPSDWKDNGKPIIRIQNLTNPQSAFNRCPRTDIPEKYFVSYGDILISWSATLGVFEWTSEDALLNQHIFKVVFDKVAINKQYFRYAIMTSISEMSRHTNGATMKHIRKGDFDNIRIPSPSLSEQQSIVDYLDSAFAKIDMMKANAEKALNAAKALFQASLKEMLEPKEGWEEKKIDEICTIARGGSPRPIKDYITNDPNGLNWIKIGDTDMGGKYIYSTKEKIKPEGLKKSRWVEVDEFLLSNSMSFGRPYILKTNGCIHDGWLVLRDYQKYLNIDFFYYVLSSENVQRQFRTKAQGSTVSNLNTDRVASVIIHVPTFEEQQSIVATLDSLKSKVDRLQENYDKISQECDALKQALLRLVFE